MLRPCDFSFRNDCKQQSLCAPAIDAIPTTVRPQPESLHLICEENTMATSSYPTARDPGTIPEPTLSDPDYNDPILDPETDPDDDELDDDDLEEDNLEDDEDDGILEDEP
jgi:hypothetical protein